MFIVCPSSRFELMKVRFPVYVHFDVEGVLFCGCEKFELYKTDSQRYLMSEAPVFRVKNHPIFLF